jgi:two-component system response regulator AtoC
MVTKNYKTKTMDPTGCMESKKYNIAIVDDEEKITEYLMEILIEHINCSVEIFNDPSEAINRFKEKQFDAISLDYRMPKLTGLDVVKLLRNSNCPNSKTKILLLTGYREETKFSNSALLNEVIFLDKPVDEEKYVKWMNIILTN